MNRDRRLNHIYLAGIVVFGDELDESLAGSREYKAPCQIESVNLDPVEQLDWIKHLRVVTPTEGACPVCLLDDGIDHDHPLLKEVVIHEHVLTYLRAWGTSDRRQGHGTNM